MVPEGETERLLLRPIDLPDAEQIQAIFPKWEIVRFMERRVPWPYPDDGARRFIQQVALPAMARGDSWDWTLRLKDDPQRIIGSLELRRGLADNRGFWLGHEWQGLGLMTEACVWANDFWFEKLGFPLLRVSKAAGNHASRRVSEKMGMRLVQTGEKEYLCGRLDSELWEISAAEWQAWKAAHVGPQSGSPAGDIL